MHVCFVLPPIEYYSPATGGALASVAAGQAQELLKRAYRVSVLAPRCDGEIYPIGEVTLLDIGTRQSLSMWQRGFSSKIVRPLRGYDWLYSEYYWPTLIAPLKSLQPDVVMVFNDVQTPSTIRRILPDAKIVLQMHNQQSTNARRPLEFLGKVDAIVTCSDFIRDWTIGHYNLSPQKIHTLHNGIDTAQFHASSEEVEIDFLRDCGPLRVAMAGRIDPNKGGDLVAQAVIDLQHEGLPIQLVVAGGLWFHGNEEQEKDPYFQRLKNLLDKAGAEYLGHIPRSRMPDFYRSCDVACVPSRVDEPFGLVALEAMACGCTVIAANRGGLPEFCDGAAIMIDAEKPGSVTEALNDLLGNKEKLRALKRAGVARAAEYSWGKIGDRLKKLLSSI